LPARNEGIVNHTMFNWILNKCPRRGLEGGFCGDGARS
jgi:hypothetical protein